MLYPVLRGEKTGRRAVRRLFFFTATPGGTTYLIVCLRRKMGVCPFKTDITGKRPACAVRRVMIRPAPDSRCRIYMGIRGFRSERLFGEIRL